MIKKKNNFFIIFINIKRKGLKFKNRQLFNYKKIKKKKKKKIFLKKIFY